MATMSRGRLRLNSFHLELLGRFLATVRHNLIFDYLSLIESAQARAFDSRDMNEHVLASGLRLDEPVSLGWIEPLHSALGHLSSPDRWRAAYQIRNSNREPARPGKYDEGRAHRDGRLHPRPLPQFLFGGMTRYV